MEYNFILKYQLADSNQDMDVLVERLGEAGCDDALVGIGQCGQFALEFTREAASAEAAKRSALSDVCRAAPLAKLIEAEPDLGELAGVAEVVDLSQDETRRLLAAPDESFRPNKRLRKAMDAADLLTRR